MSKRVGLFFLILCLLFCACVPTAPAVEAVATPAVTEAAAEAAVEIALPTAAVVTPVPTATPTFVPPTATPTPTATARVRLWEPCADDGVSGVGTVRGNTNPNLNMCLHSGTAVRCDGRIYYTGARTDDETVTASLLRYTEATKRTDVLWEYSAAAGTDGLERYEYNIFDLNILGDTLYFRLGGSWNESSVWKLSLSDLTAARVTDGRKLVAAYGKLFVQSGDDTVIIDCADTNERSVIPGFLFQGVMDGYLFGKFKDDEQDVRLDCCGSEDERFSDSLYPNYILINGYAIGIDDLILVYTPEGYLDHTGIVRVTAVTADRGSPFYGFVVPEIPCSGYYSASAEYLYIQTYYEDEHGDVWRIRWDGTGLEQVDRRVFANGFMLDGDTLLVNTVPCDVYSTDRAAFIPSDVP